jgi:hypothetical protein
MIIRPWYEYPKVNGRKNKRPKEWHGPVRTTLNDERLAEMKRAYNRKMTFADLEEYWARKNRTEW